MRSIFVLVLLAATSYGLLQPRNMDLYPMADTYLESDTPLINYGLDPDGYMGTDEGGAPFPNYDLITMFNVSAAPNNLTAASVIYQQEGIILDELFGPYCLFTVYQLYPNWTENTATWGNAPAYWSSTAILTDYQDNDVTTVTFPVLSIIQVAQTFDTAVLSFRVTSQYSAVPLFMSNSPLQYRPVLQVTWMA